MPFLLTQIFGLLLAAVALGAALAWWRFRKRYEDVTTEYTALSGDWRGWRQGVDQRLAQPVAPGGSELGDRLNALDQAVKGIEIPAAEKTDLQPVLAAIAGIRMPAATDLSGVLARLNELDARLQGLRIPDATPPTDLGPVLLGVAGVAAAVKAIPSPTPTDLSSVLKAVDSVRSQVAAIRMPEIPAAPNLGPLLDRVAAVERAVAAIRIPPPVAPDFTPINQRLSALDARIGGIRMPEIPAAPPPVDLAPTHARLAKLEEAIAAIKIPQPVAPDFSAVTQRLAALDARIGGIRMPEIPAAPPPVDLAPMHLRMGKLEEAVAAIKFPAPVAPDFTAINQRLAALDTRIGGIRMPEIPVAAPVDLGPMQVRMKAIEDAIAAIRIPQPAPPADFRPLMARIDALEARIAAIRIPAPAPVVVQAPPAPVVRKHVRSGSRNLLNSAAYGKPDDLKIIVGIGPVLEKMLHGIGVYYFWQVGEWTADDVTYVDSKLTAFKGRIKRDDWVPQAARLALEPSSATKPPEDEV